MNVGVVGIPSTVWMTEGIYCCPVLEVMPEHHRRHIWMDARYCPSDFQNVVSGVDEQGGASLPPVLKIAPECHRRCTWLGKHPIAPTVDAEDHARMSLAVKMAEEAHCSPSVDVEVHARMSLAVKMAEEAHCFPQC